MGERGFDGGKLVKGRKRHIVVDTLGNLLAILVLPANLPDREAAKYVLRLLMTECPRLERILAAGSYTGEELATWVDEFLSLSMLRFLPGIRAPLLWNPLSRSLGLCPARFFTACYPGGGCNVLRGARRWAHACPAAPLLPVGVFQWHALPWRTAS